MKRTWIKSTTEKPNYDFEVTVCDKHNNVTNAWWRKNEIWEDYEGNELYFITHWMPLPSGANKLK